MADADWTGIDAPFGWPERFVEAIYSYRHLAKWPECPRSDELRLRTTDRFVTHAVRTALGVSVLPLSVSSDRIAARAWRCAALLSELHRRTGTELDRIGVPLTRDSQASHDDPSPAGRAATHRVVESYPAAALAMWNLPYKGCKSTRPDGKAAASKQREAIVAGIEEAPRPARALRRRARRLRRERPLPRCARLSPRRNRGGVRRHHPSRARGARECAVRGLDPPPHDWKPRLARKRTRLAEAGSAYVGPTAAAPQTDPSQASTRRRKL